MNRRNLLKTLSLSLGASIISTEVIGSVGKNSFLYSNPKNPLHQPQKKAITVITIGAGNRGMVYGDFAAKFTEEMDIIGVAEPLKYRNDRYARIHKIEDKNRFNMSFNFIIISI